MAAITTRQTTGTGATVKNSPLSNQEIDQNFIALNNDIYIDNYPTIAPSLNLDFANSETLDPRITFTRSSSATYYDGITTAKAEQNLLTWSHTFSNAVWNPATAATVVSTTVVAPDGTSTALELNYTGQFGGFVHNGFNVENGKTYTISFWSRRDSGTNVIHLVTNNGVQINSYSPTTTWTRYSFTYTHATTASSLRFIQDRNTSGFTNVQLWGCQVEERSFLTTYTSTTTASITNYIPQMVTAAIDTPRFDNNPITGESLGLLVEDNRTNLLLYSSDFDNNPVWSKINTSINANIIIAPDGTLSGDKLVITSTSAQHVLYQSVVTVTSQTYTQTFYIKKAEWSQRIRFSLVSGGNVVLSLATSQPTLVSSDLTVIAPTITDVGNGWYRISMVAVEDIGGTMQLGRIVFQDNSGNENFAGDNFSGIYIWGGQIESGSFATSYIPTAGSQVTRGADNATISGTNFTNWFNQRQGTITASFSFYSAVPTDGYRGGIIGMGPGTYAGSNAFNVFQEGGTQNLSAYFVSTTYPDVNLTRTLNVAANAINSFSYAYSQFTNSYGFCTNGQSVSTGTSTQNNGSFNSITIGARNSGSVYTNGYIRRIAYYPVRLTDVQLQAITA